MKILFILICALTGFSIGAFVGAATLPEGSGLAGPAIVVVYGLVVCVAAGILSSFLVGRFNKKLIVRLIIILALLNLIPIGWMIYRLAAEADRIRPDAPVKRTPTEIKGSVLSVFNTLSSESFEAPYLGLGMASPDYYDTRNLYFFSKPNLGKSVQDHTPIDSIVFIQTEHHKYEISYAPPWFYPEHLKLDYDIFYLKILSMNRDWLEVELNKEDGRTFWIPQNEVIVYFWPEFLLNVFSIENPNPIENPLRVKPLQHASEVHGAKYEYMRPIIIKDNWLLVNLMDKDFNSTGEGWIKWNDNGKLAILYYLLL